MAADSHAQHHLYRGHFGSGENHRQRIKTLSHFNINGIILTSCGGWPGALGKEAGPMTLFEGIYLIILIAMLVTAILSYVNKK